MKWAFGVEVTNDFGQTLTLFQDVDGTWKPFARVLHGPMTSQQACNTADEMVLLLQEDVYVYSAEMAQALTQEQSLDLLSAVAYGPPTIFDKPS